MGLFDKFRKSGITDNQETLNEFTMLMLEKKYDEAFELHNKHFNKKHASDWYTRGNILCNLQKNEDAFECYKTAIKLEPNYVKAFYRLGQLYFQNGMFSEASKMFVQTSKLEKNKPYPEWNVACWFYNMLCLHHVYIQEVNPNDLEKRDRHIKKLRKMIIFDDKRTNDEFVEYCVDNFQNILDELEPKIIADFRSTEHGKQHGSKIIRTEEGTFETLDY